MKKEKNTKKNSSSGKTFLTKAFRAGGYSTAASAVVIVIAVIINLIVSGISTAYTNIDTTEAGLYSVSEQTKARIAALENEVTIYYVASADARAGYVTKLIDKFVSCGSNLKAKDINPDLEPDFASKYTDETVVNGDLLVVCGDKAQVVHYSDMIEYEAGSYEYYYYYLQNGRQTNIYWNGEIEIIKAIDYVTSTKTYHVSFLDIGGDGDFSVLEDALDNENIICSTFPENAEKIPEDTDCVVIADMDADFSENAYKVLLDYLNGGGNLYIAVDFSAEKRPQTEKLLSQYGIRFTDATLEDGDRNFEPKSLLYPKYTGEHAIISPFSNANYLCFPNAMGIIETETDGVSVTPLLITSESAYLSTDEKNDLHFGQFYLGVVADNADTGAQVVVYGTAGYMAEEYMSDTRYANSDLFINSVGYLCDKDNAIAVHAKAITSDTTLDFGNVGTSSVFILIAAAPALLSLIAGFIIWYRRKNR